MPIFFKPKAQAQTLNETVPATPEAELKTAVRNAIAKVDSEDQLIEGMHITPEVIQPSDERYTGAASKLSRLIDDNFPFDESQLRAVRGMMNHPYACLTGAAGTGKTTTTKKFVDSLLNDNLIGEVNMGEYFKRGDSAADAEDDYEIPANYIPSICLVGFTGRSAQMIKKNFPRDWHGNIMTIHRMLAYVPEYYDDFDDESQEVKTKMRFVPTYTADCKLPWDIIIIDEAGMVGLDLWHNVWAAAKKGCRIYFIGDINQLPPVHGRSVFGFAMDKFPSYELTHIHRQQGKDNPIVDNAWRVLKGQMPVSQGRFQMVELKGDASLASRQVRAMMPKMKERGVYDPIRDTIITAINGEDNARGYALGQIPLNREFALIFNPRSASPRFVIDGGREKKYFAVGDKVMATKNDHEAGITNGMTGIITSITANAQYAGEHRRFGLLDEVEKYMLEDGENEEEDNFTLEELHNDMMEIQKGKDAKKEKRDRGPASHIVTVRFGEGEHSFEMPFGTLGEVGTLMTAYVVTCHKMQGGESPCVVIILHDAHAAMHYREWLYTAITRASQMCILLYSPTALRKALLKQSIKGSTLKEKIAYFNSLNTNNGIGKAVNVTLPEYEWDPANEEINPDELGAIVAQAADIESTDIAIAEPAEVAKDEPRRTETVSAPTPAASKPQPVKFVFKTTIHQTVVVAPAPKAEPIELKVHEPKPQEAERLNGGELLAIESAAPQDEWKQRALWMAHDFWNDEIGNSLKHLRLTYQPQPEPTPEPPKPRLNPWAARLNAGKKPEQAPVSTPEPEVAEIMEAMPKAGLKEGEMLDARTFVLAGKAVFTLTRPDGTHFTYRVNRVAKKPGAKEADKMWFVNLGTGYDDSIYMGMLRDDAKVLTRSMKSKVGDKAPSWVTFQTWWDKINAGEDVSDYRFQHAGRCCVCARELTNPESIAMGIGPECAGRM